MSDELNQEAQGIAVIGMACRYPGAESLEAYWELLRNGVEALTVIPDDELEVVDESWLNHPQFVRVQGVMANPAGFDAGFFGINPREAGLMDPQQRFFMECAWHALEHAGYDPAHAGKGIGVFAGADSTGYEALLRRDPALMKAAGSLQIMIGNAPDHLAPRLSYLLNLRGPSVPVQTACSTSLVSVHLACANLLGYECDMALAGGVSIPAPHRSGYIFEEGGALSPDGHCRAFDAESKGTGIGSGVGVVILKRLEDALADGDHIHAVLLGSAINNDGSEKIGYTAPSVEGQRRVIREALAVAEIEPDDISYLETHGTGTTLGDPIELEALNQAFAGQEFIAESCAIGSVKTNIGHANSAAGIAGLIKTVLSMEHKTLLPSLRFETPNPKIDFSAGPFYVNTEAKPWEGDARYAGVSSFGIGGTNAHVVLGQAPTTAPSGSSREVHILKLAAKTSTALEHKRTELLEWVRDHSDQSLADMCFTANTGRKDMPCREAYVFSSRAELIGQLEEHAQIQGQGEDQGVVFLFPGQGADYPRLGGQLYQKEMLFKREIDHCCELLTPMLGLDLRQILFAEAESEARVQLRQATYWQPAMFVIEFGLAKWFMSYGIKPRAMMGHSIGEYVAATLAGVLTLEDGLLLISQRGRLTERLAEGAMVAVVMEEARVKPFLGDGVCLAAVNGPMLCVLSGEPAAVAETSQRLRDEGVHVIGLASDRAFHSHLMEPIMAELATVAAGFKTKPPAIPYISNVTGQWVQEDQYGNPDYWAQHMREAVQFNAGLELLFKESGPVFLEVGPGTVLANLTNRHPECSGVALTTLEPEAETDQRAVLENLARLWCAGVAVDWQSFYADEERRRLVLPLYPFEHTDFWPVTKGSAANLSGLDDPLETKLPKHQWLLCPTWKQGGPLAGSLAQKLAAHPQRWMILADKAGLGSSLAETLNAHGQEVIQVISGSEFRALDEVNLTMNPDQPDHYADLADRLAAEERLPDRIVFGFGMGRIGQSLAQVSDGLGAGLDGLLHWAQQLFRVAAEHPCAFHVLSQDLFDVVGEQPNLSWQGALLGTVRVIPSEFPKWSCQLVDLAGADAAQPDARLINSFLKECLTGQQDDCVALRGGKRWLPDTTEFDWSSLSVESTFSDGGTYLITNGLQELALGIAHRLLEQPKTRVILSDRHFFPKPEEWEGWIEDQGEDDFVSQFIRRFQAWDDRFERCHLFTGDAGNEETVGKMVTLAEAVGGELSGVFHLNRTTPDGLILTKSPYQMTEQLRSKLTEAATLASVVKPRDFLVFSSENAAEGGFGQVEQAATYSFLSHLASALRARGLPATSVEWGTRQWVEMSYDPSQISAEIEEQLSEKRERFGMTLDEAMDCLELGLASGQSQILVSTRHYGSVLAQQREFNADFFNQNQKRGGNAGTAYPRPELSVPYQPPASELEGLVAELWEKMFDLEQVGTNDNFFELGGHSLLAVQLLNELNRTFAVTITMNQLFDAPTAGQVAVLISEAQLSDEEAQDLEALLAEIEGLSDTEIDQVMKS